MRGQDEKQDAMFSYVAPERRVPADHPLRKIRALVDEVLREMSREFSRLDADTGRPSIAPERCCGRCCCRSSTRSAVSGC
jgi:transposase